MNKKIKKAVNTDQSRTFVQNVTDTFTELALIFLAIIVVSGIGYSLFENKSVLDGFWWAIVTAFTVGYGDSVPNSVGGRIIAGLLMTISVFIVVPIITARMASKMIVNDDAWTNQEQEEIKRTNKRLNKWLDEQPKKKKKKK